MCYERGDWRGGGHSGRSLSSKRVIRPGIRLLARELRIVDRVCVGRSFAVLGSGMFFAFCPGQLRAGSNRAGSRGRLPRPRKEESCAAT